MALINTGILKKNRLEAMRAQAKFHSNKNPHEMSDPHRLRQSMENRKAVPPSLITEEVDFTLV